MMLQGTQKTRSLSPFKKLLSILSSIEYKSDLNRIMIILSHAEGMLIHTVYIFKMFPLFLFSYILISVNVSKYFDTLKTTTGSSEMFSESSFLWRLNTRIAIKCQKLGGNLCKYNARKMGWALCTTTAALYNKLPVYTGVLPFLNIDTNCNDMAPICNNRICCEPETVSRAWLAR